MASLAAPGTAAGRICLFAKPPRSGDAKTRLVPAVGRDGAAALAGAFLADTWHSLSALVGARVVLATTDPRGDHAPIPTRVPRWDQGLGDLGARLERVLTRALVDAPWAIAIGADSPGRPQGHLRQAIRSLQTGADAVLSMSDDGGFTLVGLRRCPAGLFDMLPWSAETTGAAMLARLQCAGLQVQLLSPWFDVDDAGDLDRLAMLLGRGRVAAPQVQSILDSCGQRVCLDARLSVVMPVLNEAERIVASARRAIDDPDIDEVIVVDGGSRDGTAELARTVPGVRAVVAPPGRAVQMNAGAALATGDLLAFVHADVRLPARAGHHIQAALRRPHTSGAAFVTWTMLDGGDTSWLGPWIHLADVRSRLTRYPYGDQVLCVRRTDFDRAGGFPQLPLMEDLALSHRLTRHAPMARIPHRVEVSGRRIADRPLFTTAIWNIFPTLFRCGVPAATLARWYRHVR